ncbi:MAG TPA: ABC transporter ATP-binding protein [Pseudonocardiaceae bacterium]|jgi:ATP-binding cassette subfamily B protein|nr:ABC transporter ATP-binding protein [Pseudonocardiaceae bacterium]
MQFPLALRVAAPAARPHVPALGAAAVLALVRAGVTLAEPWPLAMAVDHAINHRPLTGALAFLNGISPFALLVAAGVALVLLNAVIGVLDMAGTLLGERAAERIGATLRQAVFDRSMSLSLRWHDRMRSGELVSRLTSDVGRILDGVIAVTTTVLPDTVMVATVLVVLTTFDPELALIGLAVVPALAVLAVRQRNRVRYVQSEARHESGQLAAITTDLFRNVRAVQAFGRIGRARAIFGARNRRVLEADLETLGVEARWSPMADLVLSCGAGLVLIVGGAHVLTGGLTVGSLLVVLAYLDDLYAPVRGLAKLAGALAKAGASATRIHEVFTATEAIVDAPDARQAPLVIRDVQFEHVEFCYEPGVPVLRDFNLTVNAGETVCLFGPSGAGKSTVLQLLLRLYDIDAGRILVDGMDIRDLDRYSLRKRMAFVPQDPWLLDASIAENIAFGSRRATRAEVLDAGAAALVDEFVTDFPQGYDTPVGEAGVRLSGGQRRRVALARAAVSEAPIMLLDEPTAGLDQESAEQVVQAIRGSTAARTVLLITHDRDLAAIADRTVLLDRAATPVVPAASRA